MLKKVNKILLSLILFLSNSNIIYALNITDNKGYSIYYNGIKSNIDYSVAEIEKGDRIFYDLDNILSIFRIKGGKNVNIYKLGEKLEPNNVETPISYIAKELGSDNKEINELEIITDTSLVKENDNIAITTKLNDKLIYGITNEIGTNKFIPFAIIKYDIYVNDDSNVDSLQYEIIIFDNIDIGADVESYVNNGKVYYPIRFVSELLGGIIDLNYRTSNDKNTSVLITFDTKKDYTYKYIFSSSDDESNNTLSKNECMDIEILNNNKKINKHLYNVNNPNLKIVQKSDLNNFITDNNKLMEYESKSDRISVCNSSDKIDVSNITFDIFVGSKNENFIPTNLTITNNEIQIKNTENITVNTYTESKINNIGFKTSNNDVIELDNTFSTDIKEYTTKENLKNTEENICFDITFEDGSIESDCAYMDPSKSSNKIIISDYSFNILRNMKDSNTNIGTLKYKKTSENEWKNLEKNSENKYVIEGKYNDYEIIIIPEKETSSVISSNATITNEKKEYKLIPSVNVQTFSIKAEDGTEQEYSITFDESNIKETLESLEVYQGNTKLPTTGPDANNKYITENWDTSLGGTLVIKYKIKDGKSGELTVYPNPQNNNTLYVHIQNNVYSVLVKEKEKIENSTSDTTSENNNTVSPITCSSTNVLKTGKTTTSLNIRTAPNTKTGQIIKTLQNGQYLEIVQEKDGWYQVKYPSNLSKCGWVSSKYVKTDTSNNENEGGAIITVDTSQSGKLSKEIRTECLSDSFQKKWVEANKSSSKTVKAYLKSSGGNNFIDYSSAFVNEFEIIKINNNYETIKKQLTLALILERGENSGGITYSIKRGYNLKASDFDKLYGKLNNIDTSTYNAKNNLFTSRTSISSDIEYCINSLVDKTKVGNKVNYKSLQGLVDCQTGTCHYSKIEIKFNGS